MDREQDKNPEPLQVAGEADSTLISETLRMMPEERPLLNDQMIRTMEALHRGFGQSGES